MKKQHVKKCLTLTPKYHGEARNFMGDELKGGEFCDCDGYHTFDELYDHRIELFIRLCDFARVGTGYPVWRSKLHSDGSSWNGWFILGIHTEDGKQITYHLPISKWEETNFAETLGKAPDFDGHTSDDVLERLKLL